MKDYQKLLSSLKEKIKQGKIRAAFTLNNQMLSIYWEIGKDISNQEEIEGWGAKTIDRLAKDLKLEFPDMKGLSSRSLRYMREFSIAYPDFIKLQQPAAKSQKESHKKGKAILQQAAAKLKVSELDQAIVGLIPWSHHLVILDKIKPLKERLFYIKKTVENGWGRNVLSLQIDSKLYDRQGKSITNFDTTLPQVQSDLVSETLKNPFVFEFLELDEQMKERDVEKSLIKHMREFLSELGRGFAYVGNQVNLTVNDDEFFADLLFFNYVLNCFVIFELKVGDFKPEYAGQLNFYVNTVDEKIKNKMHNPTIGVLLCKTPNETVIKYSLKGITSPIGVSDYKLGTVQKQLKPTIKELKLEFENEIEKLKTPAEKRLDILKQKLASLNKTEVKTGATFDLLKNIFDQSIKPLFENIFVRIKEFEPDFLSTYIFWHSGNQTIHNFQDLEVFWKEEENLKQNRDINFQLRLGGLRKAGVDAFDIVAQLVFTMDVYWYGFKLINYDNHQPFIKKLYTEQLSAEEISEICERICNQIMDSIEWQLGGNDRFSKKR